MKIHHNRMLIGLAAIVVFAAAVFLGVAYSRGALTFANGKPHFNRAIFMHPRPSLNRGIVFPADFSPEARQLFNDNLAKLKEELNAGEKDASAWFDLAIYYRMVGDHEGAVQIWKYLTATYPRDGVAYHNLGEYYFHTVQDYQKAEQYYRQSIAVDPKITSNFTDLHEMYKYAYKQDTGAAIEILQEGIQKASALSALQFMILAAQYDAEKGDISGAQAYYKQAIELAKQLKNKPLADQLAKDLARIR